MLVLPLVVIALGLFAVPDSVFENLDAWERVGTDGELTLSQRPIKGSALFEYRIVMTATLPVETLCSAIFEWGTKSNDGPGVKLSKLLKDGDDERLVYAQIEQPMISNRDYAMTVKKQSAGDGACRIRFKVTNQEAPPTPEGFVRMENMWGSWLFEPQAGGKTKVTHLLYADPGGSVPPFLVHGGAKSSAKKNVLLAVEKAKAAAAAK